MSQMRRGKTKKDPTSGSHSRHLNNQIDRGNASRENQGSFSQCRAEWPVHLCKGKGNSSKARKFKPSKILKQN